MRIHPLVLAILALAFSSAPAFGCKCFPPPPDIRNARELAELAADGSDAIFEGRVERIELKWAFLEAKAGDLISVDVEHSPPVMQVSFDVARSYRGAQQKNVRIRTGVGGGDCGFKFEVGKQYLVYAFAGKSGQLATGICSGTARLEESKANLSYMRGEPIVPESVGREIPVAEGQLWGRVVRAGFDFANGQVLLLRVGIESFVPSGEADLASDGSFCADGVIAGKYHLVFMNGAEGSPTSFAFFPGVVESSQAGTVEVKSGQANSELVFTVPPQPTFSVSGTVHASPKSALPAACKVALMSTNPLSFALTYAQDVAPDGSFDFQQVLPGTYWAVVAIDSDDGSNWLTRKAQVEVDATVANLSLELIAK